MPEKTIGRPRTGSKARELFQGEAIPSGQDSRRCARKLKAQIHSNRRPIYLRLYAWLSGSAPAALRIWLSSIPSLPALVLAYCLFSVLLFSGHVSSTFFVQISTSVTRARGMSSLDKLSFEHIASKVSSLRPPPLLLDPDVLSTGIDSSAVAACAWTTEAELEMAIAWATRWTGPVSLLVTTTVVPSSAAHVALLTKLANIHNRTPLLKAALSVHVLHLHPATELHSNALLNVARLLSPGTRAVLFPGNLSSAPPKNLYKTLLSQQPSSSSALTSGRIRKRRPVILTLKDHTSFPFAPLAPLVIARDDSIWCTERFFAGMSRAADWEECLWQIWLANFGDVEVRQVQGWESMPLDDHESGAMENPAAIKLHRRLVSKFRGETCALAIRRFAALRDVSNSADTKKARWLKRVCRSWTST